jgi:phage/plasmid-like protein (TIGR03299 family)
MAHRPRPHVQRPSDALARLGVVLDEHPRSIEEALEKAGLGWKVTHADVLVVKTPARIDDFGTEHPRELIPAKGFKANLREDAGQVLGIVSDEYEVVDNIDAFRFLDALIGSEMHFETAGSLWGGRRVWVLARRPKYIELGGDRSATHIYVANSHDGSMAVTAAVTPIRIVCANTLAAALSQAEHGVNARRTFRFRHTGNLQSKFAEARQVLGTTVNYELTVQGARGSARARTDHPTPARAQRAHTSLDDRRKHRQAGAGQSRADDRARTHDLRWTRGRGGHHRQQSRLEWCAWNAIAEQVDYGRRYSSRSNQVQRSFEDNSVEQRALSLPAGV